MSVRDRFEDWRERVGGTSVLLSVLVHVILAILILTDVVLDHDHGKAGDEPQAVEVSLVPERKAPAPSPLPPPPPQQQPEQSMPPEPEPQPEPPMPVPKPTPPEPPKPILKPLLDPGKLAKESKAAPEKEVKDTHHSWLDDAHEDDAPKKAAETSPFAKSSQAMTVGKGGSADEVGGQATQSERDYLLAQILKPWRNRPNFNWQPDAIVQLRVVVMPDGYLAPPFDARQRYSPELAIMGYGRMAPNDPRRIVLESLYSVLRVAQPLTLPPELRAKAPFNTRLDFRLVDIP